jgi:hypothetical protein
MVEDSAESGGPEPGEDQPSTQPDTNKTANRAVGLGLGSWVVLWLAGKALGTLKESPPDTSPEFLAGYYALPALMALGSVILGIAAVVTGVSALRRRERGRDAWIGIVLGASLPLLVGAAVLVGVAKRSGSGAFSEPVGPPLTGDEVAAFAAALEADVVQGRGTPLRSSLHVDSLVARVVEGQDLPAAFERGFRSTLDAPGRFRLDQELRAALMEPAARYVLIRTTADPPRALFRLTTTDGLNYHEFYLLRGPDGGVQWDDLFIFVLGERLSEVGRRAAALELAGQRSGDRSESEDSIRMMELFHAGRFEDVLRHYRGLPPAQRRRRELVCLRLLAAAEVSDEEYALVLSDIARMPLARDPSMSLMLLDHWFFSEDYGQCLQALDDLDARVQDPYLDAVRADAYRCLNDYGRARALAEAAAGAEPDLPDAWSSLLRVVAEQPDYPRALEVLDELSDLGVDPDLEADPFFAEFVRTKAYANWKRRRG